MRARYDLASSALALFAAALAFTGYVAATRDQYMDDWERVSWVLAGAALVALLLAVVPSGWRWSSSRRALAGIVGTLLVVVALPTAMFSAAVPGCACIDPLAVPKYYGPVILGLPHLVWVLAGLFGSPALILTAGLIRRRSPRAEMPRSPEA